MNLPSMKEAGTVVGITLAAMFLANQAAAMNPTARRILKNPQNESSGNGGTSV